MSHNWITSEEAVGMISKQSHHKVSPHHLQTLVKRKKIGTRAFPGGRTLLKRCDVQATRVATDTGKNHRP